MEFTSGKIFAGAAAATMLATSAAAQTYTIIYNPPKEAAAEGRLLRDSAASGVFYGTTFAGNKLGTVFELREKRGAWKGSAIFKFGGGNGDHPAAGLVEDDSGTLYGTTTAGGAFGEGVVFALTPQSETILHSFAGGSDGAEPYSDLVMDKATGALYGTTVEGGSANCGTVFQITQSGGVWTETVLHAFTDGTDGCFAYGDLRMDKKGNLFGITRYGGTSGAGTVFELSELNQVWTESVIYTFKNQDDGEFPYDLDLDGKNERLYGVSESGGASGGGTAFELSKRHGFWRETTLHGFGSGSDGAGPVGIRFDASVNTLYGTTIGGGTSGYGTVFKLQGPSWQENVFHNFSGGPDDGAEPFTRPIEDPNTGYLYGTTPSGGENGGGIVYQVIP